jgi:hypothetical protein
MTDDKLGPGESGAYCFGESLTRPDIPPEASDHPTIRSVIRHSCSFISFEPRGRGARMRVYRFFHSREFLVKYQQCRFSGFELVASPWLEK